MHQTTVRFGPDLWGELEVEARRAGVSVAQYVRDSALMRVAYTRGRAGDPHYEAALEAVAPPQQGRLNGARGAIEESLERAGEDPDDRAGIRAQDAQAQRHARELGDRAKPSPAGD